MGFPGSSADKEPACNAGDPGFDSWVGKIPWIAYPLRYSWAFLVAQTAVKTIGFVLLRDVLVSEDFRNAELMVEKAGHCESQQWSRELPGWIREGPVEGKIPLLSPGELVETRMPGSHLHNFWVSRLEMSENMHFFFSNLSF